MRELESDLNDNCDMIELGEEEGDDDVVTEAEQAIATLKDEVAKRGLECLLSGELDANNAYLQINAGAGGTESCDWAGMILRMYLRWADKRGFKVSIMDHQDGDVAGVKSSVLEITGDNVYGWLKSESGVHRLVRISPFDSASRRHTSFCSVAVTPMLDDDIDIKIDTKDLRIDTYRASGSGGQHVNTTDSAVRITHLPTNIVVQCQNQRSQLQNRETAMKMLKAKLYEKEIAERDAEKADREAAKTDIAWGHQIRSYVLHPYQMIKDLRTNVETSNSSSVLDGDIDMFLEASLASKLAGAEVTEEDDNTAVYEQA